MTEISGTEEKTRSFLKFHSLMSGVMGLLASLILLATEFPSHRELSILSLFAAVMYLTYFFFFKLICRTCYKHAGVILSQIGVGIVTCAVYFTGGIVSPFIFLYFALLLSEAMYGLENPVTLPASLAGYLLTVAVQFFGLLPNPAPWSEAVYRSPLGVALIAFLTSAYLAMTRGVTGRIIYNLRAKIESETVEKAGLLKKFSELNASAQIGALAHRIAHDLRAPLSSISGYVQMELLNPRSETAKTALADLNATVDGMAEALSCITRFGKPSEVPAERIQVSEFFRQLLAIAAFSPNSRGVRFVKKYQEDLDAWVCASRSEMQQAYFNIVKNAMEATQDNSNGRVIEVTVRRVDKEVEICLADNGPGMRPEALKEIFRKLITTKKNGTGVGLVITRDILARNDGYIEFRNRPEGGLEVTTRLPAA